jgi:hypothetical protein
MSRHTMRFILFSQICIAIAASLLMVALLSGLIK